MASSGAVTVPTGDANTPTFSAIAPSSNNYIVANCVRPTADKIYPGFYFAGGYMVFLSGTGSTLQGCWSAVGQNGEYTDGHGNHHSEFQLYTPLPWPPTPDVNTFYISPTAPMNLGDTPYFGFPYVPAPRNTI